MTTPRMFATLLETAGSPAPKPGDLVLIEVPLNCTIHSVDAARIALLRGVATALAAQWRSLRIALRPPARLTPDLLTQAMAGFRSLCPLLDELAKVADPTEPFATACASDDKPEALSR